MSTASSNSAIIGNIAFASLDQEVFELLQSSESIERLSEALSTAWFDRGLVELRAVVAQSNEVSRYEHRLRQGPVIFAQAPLPPAYVRDAAFRRVVTQAYDYRCAATGPANCSP